MCIAFHVQLAIYRYLDQSNTTVLLSFIHGKEYVVHQNSNHGISINESVTIFCKFIFHELAITSLSIELSYLNIYVSFLFSTHDISWSHDVVTTCFTQRVSISIVIGHVFVLSTRNNIRELSRYEVNQDHVIE